MVVIREFRVVMPLTVDEYKIGQLYTVAHLSKLETGGGDGVEVIKNEPFTNNPIFNNQYAEGQYTRKRYTGKHKVSGFLRTVIPDKALIVNEEAWNAYPYCRTVIKNEYMGSDFELRIETLHLPGRGEVENAHHLSPDLLKQREVVLIDIAADIASTDFKVEEDPATFKSKKTGRGPLKPGWISSTQPCMTCYKLVTVKFKWLGLQSLVEHKIMKYERRLFTIFHRQVFCQIDNWHGLTIEDIRAIEHQTQSDLLSVINTGEARGLTEEG